MIKYIRFNNFYSYLDETEVLFELNKQATTSAYDFTVETAQNKIRLNKIMAVLGANGSGKTQLLKALDFVVWFISFSALTKENRDNGFTFSPHFLSESKDCNFELRFLLANHYGLLQEYKYELKIVNQTIIEENLFVKSSSQFSYIFKRIYNQGELNYKHKDFLKPSLADDIPNNVSLISYAFLFDIKLAQVIIDLFGRTQSNVSPNGKLNKISQSLIETTELFNRNEMLKSHAENLLCKFDTGIQEIRLKEVTVLTEDKSESKQILLPFGVHKTSDGKEFELVFFQESNGTQSAYNLLGLILPVLQNGGVAIIDELDNDLHPHLLPEIFNLFRSEHTNPHNAQLIFTCHTPEVFNILNKHQIYLVEKIDQQSEAWRLDEVEGVRNDDNLYAKYMAGAFSAVPNL